MENKKTISNETFLKIMTYSFEGEAKTNIIGKKKDAIYPLFYIIKNSQDEKTLNTMNEIINNYVNITSKPYRRYTQYKTIRDGKGNVVMQYTVLINIPEDISNNIIELATSLKNKIEKKEQELCKDLQKVK